MQLWAFPSTEKKRLPEGGLQLRHGDYIMLLQESFPSAGGSSELQTNEVIQKCLNVLADQDMILCENVLRTWYYTRDVDNNYAGMIRSRTRCYEAQGLTPETHFIVSTGIEAHAQRPEVLSWLVMRAGAGLDQRQISYLQALDYLSPTHVYGVNFERAITVQYGDRRHCHLSGTASIDREGKVVHVGDVIGQMQRTLINITALLREGNMELEHLRSCIVYLRDGHDYLRVRHLLAEKLPPDCSINFVLASVCRPDWLIEIEGEAIAPITDWRWSNFC